MKKKPATSLASPGELERLVTTACKDLLAITPMYRRLHGLGLEPRRGDTVHVSGGGENNQPANLAVESDYAESRRQYARWVAREIVEMVKRADRVRAGLERNVGPTLGYRQSETVGSDAIVTINELTESRVKQAERLRTGVE